MRVQRAPHAGDQPAARPDGGASAPATAGFSAGVDLDLTELTRQGDDHRGDVIARLVAACREEELIDDRWALQLVRCTAAGLGGARLAAAVNQSGYAIAAALTAATAGLPASSPRTLTVVVIESSVRGTGDWGWEGSVVATLGRAVPTLVPSPEHGLSVTERHLARLGLTASDPHAVVRILESVARSVGNGPLGS